MFGIRFAKFDPAIYVFRYRRGKFITQGEGLAFFYYAPSASIVAIPLGSTDAPFIFSEISADFQELTVQGQLTYRIKEPEKTSKMLNFALDSRKLHYLTDDPQKLSERLINLALIATKETLIKLPLKQAVTSSDDVARKVYGGLHSHEMVNSLGVEILSVSIAAIKPSPETSNALEAETREAILKESDQAIFARRNYAVEQERVIKESELNTEIAVEQKNREIQETRMESQRIAQSRALQMEEEKLAFRIKQEERNSELVNLSVANARKEADAKAYALREIMKVYEEMNPEILKALAGAGLDSGRLMALAFQGIADKAEKIGNLNITPDLLESIMQRRNPRHGND
ncbi:MAG: SPFH domain-containing protein [Treponema sp.]|jgi:hypothetical protein|nr:SPFH domain-containing protein [Treponema sp.]